MSADYPPGMKPEDFDKLFGTQTCKDCGQPVSNINGPKVCDCEDNTDFAYEQYRDIQATYREAEQEYEKNNPEPEEKACK